MDRGRKRKADSFENGSTPSKRQKVPDDPAQSVTLLGLKLVESMKNAKDKTGRSISDLFLDLPRKKEVPDYYDVIKLPIAISTVERKLRNNEYNSLTEIESDFKRMVANAKQYNDDGSEVYADAERVRKMLHNWMKAHNPDHKRPDYVPFPTPIPGEDSSRRRSVNGNATQTPDDIKTEAKDDARPKRPTITLSKGRRNSEIQVAPSVESKEIRGRGTRDTPSTNEFEGKSFGQVQEQILDEFIQWRDEDDFAEFQPFVNLPPRSLTDYYQLIKRPQCLKGLVKRARGQHGRDAATGITDFKTWDSFEEEVSLIWKNAQEYNEDGSEMFDLADKFKEEFLARLADVKEKVDEPQGTRIKLNARPKPVLHLGSKASQGNAAASPGVSVDSEALERQKQTVQAGVNGHQTPQPTTMRRSNSQIATADIRTASTPPAIKTEKAVASPVIDVARPPSFAPEVKPSPNITMPPPARVPSASPLPVVLPTIPTPYVPTLAPPPATFAETFARTKPVEEALLPSIHLCSHPQLTVSKPFKLDVPASPEYTQQSMTVMLPVSQYHLQVTPTVSQQLASGRQYKLFVTVNGIRSSPTLRPVINGELTNGVEKKQVYDIPLGPGVNRIEVEIVAVTGRAGTLEVEKTTVFANLMRY